METAPLFDDVLDGPKGGKAYWLSARDGVRIRVAYWGGGDKGTVLLYPGRTEYIEKYGRVARDLLALGYSVLTIDWRGQGLADRLSGDEMLGHVERFQDFQLDVEAMNGAADTLNCPGPRFLIAHSMGGCIGLRALHNGLDVKAAVFSGPMWGLSIAPTVRPIAWSLSWFMSRVGQGENYAPGTRGETYVKVAPFLDNSLTSDSDMFTYMQKQASAHPELTLSGPSLTWLHEALVETNALRQEAPPNFPAIAFLGGNERIVDPEPIYEVMARWKGGHLEIVDGAEHEIMMEKPQTRAKFFATADELFTKHS